MICQHFLWLCLMKNSDINYFFLQGMMNSGHKGSKNSVHKGVNFHPTSTRVFRGPHFPHANLYLINLELLFAFYGHFF